MNDSSPSPPSRVPSLLGASAVLPFVAGALLAWLVDDASRPFAMQVLSAYAAVVVSFIGAIHWGLGFRHAAPPASLFVWGVVPSLAAWVAVLAPPSAGLAMHAVVLVVCYLVDRRVYVTEGVVAWLPLRLRLTVVATLCCAAGAVAR